MGKVLPFERKWFLLLAAIVLVGLAVAAVRFVLPAPSSTATYVPPPTPTPTAGTLYTVVRAQVGRELEVRGRVAPVREAYLFFPMAGWLKEVHVTLGQQVQQGDLLAELDVWELENAVVKARYTLEMRQLEISRTLAGPAPETVAVEQAQVEQAQVEVDRAEMEAAWSISEAAQTLAQARLQDAAPDLAIAQVGLERAKIALDEAQDEYTKLLDRPWEKQLVRDALAKGLAQAELDFRLAQAGKNAAEASAAELQLRVADAQEDLAHAREQAEQEVAVARVDLALAEARLAQLTAPPLPVDLAILQAGVAQAETDLLRAQARLDKARLYAPFDGTVFSLEAQVGDQVMAYAPIGTVGDPADVQVLAYVLEEDIGSVAYSQPATVALDSDPGKTYPGHVLQVAPQPVTWQGKRAYQVSIAFDEPAEVPAIVRTGCDVYIQLGSKSDVLVVRSNALHTDGNLTYVELVEDGTVTRTPVQVGQPDGDVVEIVSGLREGQTVRVP